jgi:hypothetical protein
MGTAGASRWVVHAWPQAARARGEPTPSVGKVRGVDKPGSLDRRSIAITSSQCTPGAVTKAGTANGSLPPVIANDTTKAALPVNRLERHAGTLARAVRRGGGDGDTASLPDPTLRSGFRQRLSASVRRRKAQLCNDWIITTSASIAVPLWSRLTSGRRTRRMGETRRSL